MNIVKPCAISCPYCGESVDIFVDMSVGDQQYVEDCSVCCKPMNLTISTSDDDAPQITARSDDE